MDNQNRKKISLKYIPLFLFAILVVPFLPLLISRHWRWWEAWVYLFLYVFSFALSRALAARRSPDILVERSRFLQLEDAKPWDKLLSPLVGIGSALIPLVAGLDELFNWSNAFNMTLKVISLCLILAGYVLSSYALIENRYFSGMVRIQTDRGHHVVSTGPYGWVRHPGYAGALMSFLATPIFLDSSWAFIPAVLLIIVLVIRTNLEDKTLQKELEGYQSYASRVRFRLIPGIW
ncbi:MAG: isoprenylcysteine carboxylmethyltransferase family protein [Anaerolineaceae bacterium]|nr:isoprenylcysteine carboxylmethyltransferase family protein [Anaerolineaceae bacterium]